MSDRHVTLWPDLALPVAQPTGLAEAAPARTASFRIELRDAAGTVVQRKRARTPAPVWSEFSAPDGSFEWERVAQPLSLDFSSAPPEAAFALVSHPLMAEAASFELAAAALPKATIWRNDLKPKADFAILLISEWFANKDRFWQACEQFEAALLADAAFGGPVASGKLGVTGAWWPSSPEAGLFGTRFQGERRYYGDHARAMKAARGVRKADLVIVLIDSAEWGGAGGAIGDRPAWSTIYGFNPDWTGQALHEMGHAFGLVDEYQSSGPDIAYKSSFPNVTNKRDARKCAWKAAVTSGVPVDPTSPNPAGTPVAAGTVGTFEGALYKATGLYRPSQDCRMREVHVPFCRVCAAHIAKKL